MVALQHTRLGTVGKMTAPPASSRPSRQSAPSRDPSSRSALKACGAPGREVASRSHLLLRAALLLFCLCGLAAAQSPAPSGFDELTARASAARDANDLPQAVALYRQGLQLNPQWKDGWWILGLLQYRMDAYAEAQDALTHYIDSTPQATAALALRGLCEYETADYDKSLQDIQASLALGAGNKERNESILRFHQAILLARSGRFEDALTAYGFFARQDAPAPELLEGIGLAGLRRPLLPKEVPSSEQAIYLAAGDAAFRFMSGDLVGASQSFHAFFDRFPTAANAHYLYGYLLFATDPDQAIDQFKREIQVAPTNASALSMLAWASLLTNQPAAALPYATRAVQQAPLLPVAQLALGRSMVETGDVKGGTEHLEKALRLDPGNLQVHLALARAYSEAGRAHDARRERQLCLQLTSSQAVRIANP